MKIALLIISLCFALLETKSGLSVSENKIALSINQTTTTEQLVDFKRKLLQKNITLNYESVTRDEHQLIQSIKINVNCNDGFKGSISGQFKDKEAYVGFYRNYQKDASSAFGMVNSHK